MHTYVLDARLGASTHEYASGGLCIIRVTSRSSGRPQRRAAPAHRKREEGAMGRGGLLQRGVEVADPAGVSLG